MNTSEQVHKLVNTVAEFIKGGLEGCIAALEFENADLKHDIERAVQQNTDLLAEVEALRAAVDEYALGDERYKYVRRVNANQFARLYQRNIKEGIPFDDLIDAARKGEHDEH